MEAGGNVYDASDPKHRNHGDPNGYYRAWPMLEALKTLHTTNTKALAVPVEGRDEKDALPVDVPMRTQTTRAETALAFLVEMYGTSTARAVTEPAGTFTAGGNHHGLVTPAGGTWNDDARPLSDPLRTLTSRDAYALVQSAFVTQFRERDRNLDPFTEPMRTVVADGANHALVHRMNAEGAGMTTPIWEELRTLTAGGTQALLQQPEKRSVTPADIAQAREMLPDVLFRMFEPHEVAAGMAFPPDYVWQPPDRNKPVSKRDLVKVAGNAVTPPAARDLMYVGAESMGVAA